MEFSAPALTVVSVDAPPSLSPAQRAALAHVRALARQDRAAALAYLNRTIADPHPDQPVAQLAGTVARGARLTVNFHPDRLLADGRSVAVALATEGIYRSQFETGISSGGLTAFPGGDRDRWEEGLFGGAYQAPGVLPAERPRYGGLNLMAHPDGACPRFGSAHLRLRPEVLDRTTFCFGDSYLGPAHVGTVDVFEPVLAALLRATAATGTSLGVAGMQVATLLRRLLTTAPAGGTAPGRALDDYVEAQIHGPVSLAHDVEAVVLDPSFRGTEVETVLTGAADRYGFAISWHVGFALPVQRVDAAFRGPAIPVLAERVHREFARPGDPVDAALVGRAAASLVTEPQRWVDRGPFAETLQHLKQLWHVLVRFGEPRFPG